MLTSPRQTAPMRFLSLLSLVLLMGCNAPSGYFRASSATRISVNGSVFDVRARGTLAEAVRVNPQYAPRFGPLRTRAGLAMALVTRCSVTRVLGDQALVIGRLDCPDRRPPALYVHKVCRRVADDRSGVPTYACALGDAVQTTRGASIYWG